MRNEYGNTPCVARETDSDTNTVKHFLTKYSGDRDYIGLYDFRFSVFIYNNQPIFRRLVQTMLIPKDSKGESLWVAEAGLQPAR